MCLISNQPNGTIFSIYIIISCFFISFPNSWYHFFSVILLISLDMWLLFYFVKRMNVIKGFYNVWKKNFYKSEEKKNYTWGKKTHNDSTPTDRNYQQQMNCGIWSIRGCTKDKNQKKNIMRLKNLSSSFSVSIFKNLNAKIWSFCTDHFDIIRL